VNGGSQPRIDSVAERDRALEIALDVDVTRQECFDDRQLTRWKQHAAQRAGSRDDEAELGRRARFARSIPVHDVEASRVGLAEHVVHDSPGVAQPRFSGHRSLRRARPLSMTTTK